MKDLTCLAALGICTVLLAGCGKKEEQLTASKSAGALHGKIKEHTQTTSTVAVGDSNIAFYSERHMEPKKRLRSRQQRLQQALNHE